MDLFSLSATPNIHISSSTRKYHSTSTSTSTSTSVSFSIKPPLAPPPPPPPPPEPTDSPSLRRPKSLRSTTTIPPTTPIITPNPSPRIPKKNPFQALLKPSQRPSQTPADTLCTKFRLSSKLSPPPPPTPPPPPPPPPRDVAPPPPPPLPEAKIQENESHKTEFRQEGKIFVGNLPNWIKKHEMSEFFRQFGPIQNVILIKGHNETERNAGFGFIIYDGPTAEKSAMKAVEFDGMEFHGRILTVKLDDGRRLKSKAEERKRWVGGEDGDEYKSKWHEEREGTRKAFRRVLDTQPEKWQAVVSAFERIKKVTVF